MEIEKILFEIKSDLASVKTDVTWLKRLFVTLIILTGSMFGINLSGMVL